jgi:hypothetical protein
LLVKESRALQLQERRLRLPRVAGIGVSCPQSDLMSEFDDLEFEVETDFLLVVAGSAVMVQGSHPLQLHPIPLWGRGANNDRR